MLTYKIHLIRHGLTRANLERRYIGGTDLPLCEQGVGQIMRLMETYEYPTVQRVYTSPLQRAAQTAALLYPTGLIEPCDGMRELNFGSFENRTIDDLEKDPAFLSWIAAPDTAPPGGESSSALFERTARALAGIFAHMMEERLTSVAVVTHAGIISGLLAAMGIPRREAVRWNCAPGEGYTLLLTPQMWMRDGSFEVFGRLPYPRAAGDVEESAFWEDLPDPPEEAEE